MLKDANRRSWWVGVVEGREDEENDEDKACEEIKGRALGSIDERARP